jgi:hypothetical protein
VAAAHRAHERLVEQVLGREPRRHLAEEADRDVERAALELVDRQLPVVDGAHLEIDGGAGAEHAGGDRRQSTSPT